MNVSEILLAAADYIDTHGWHQGEFVNERTGAVCAYGAINAVVGEDPYGMSPAKVDLGLIREAYNCLSSQLPEIYQRHIPHWNDDKDRTKEEVTSTMREAANKCVTLE